MNVPWITVVGIGEDGLEGLAPSVRLLIDQAAVLVGGERHLAMLPADNRERLAWPRPLTGIFPLLDARRGRPVCVLASGDPYCYGVGTTLARRYGPEALRVLPGLSAFTLACARLGWPSAEIEGLTLHGRPLALLQAYVQPGARLLILSEDGGTPAQVAGLLRERGFGASRMIVLERMGGAAERAIEATAAAFDPGPIDPLNTIAVECRAEPGASLLGRAAGLPDEAFRHDGQLTKREVRAVTLSSLVPVPGQLLWDVGAGSGSVGIEWMRSHPRCRAIAIESRSERLAFIAENAAALGTPKLQVVPGRAPAALAGLEAPDAVFIGGGIDGEGLFEACWSALRPGGRLVANVVTVEGEVRVARLHQEFGGDLSRLSVSRAEPVGPFRGWRPLMTVTQWRLTKSFESEAVP